MGDEPIATRPLDPALSAINGKQAWHATQTLMCPNVPATPKEWCGDAWLTKANATPAQCGSSESRLNAPREYDTEREATRFNKPLVTNN